MNYHKLIDKAELAEIMGISKATITNKVYKRKEGIDIPFAVRIGDSYKWKLGSVLKFIDEKEHERKVLLTSPKASGKPVSKVQINKV